MSYYIFGVIENQSVIFVGISGGAHLPSNSILLQAVEHHPEVARAKWALRFRSTLRDKSPLDHPYTKYFKNSARTKRLLGDSSYQQLSKEQNDRFLQFHNKHPHLVELLLEAAIEKKAEGREEYSVDQLLGELRWSDTEVDRGDDKVKVNATWSSWYSRVLQMKEPRLVGFFAVRASMADGLVWIDGQSWQDFASEHEDQIRWEDPFNRLPDSDEEYKS